MWRPKTYAERAADQARAREKKATQAKKLLEKPIRAKTAKPAALQAEPSAPPEAHTPPLKPSSVRNYAEMVNIPIFRDQEVTPSRPSSALRQLINLYLHAAEHRTRHIAMLWPASPRSLLLTHSVATLARWAEGDKLGVRGLVYPVRSNVFHPLNHLHLGRKSVLESAEALLENGPNPHLTRGLREKDTYLFSLASLKPDHLDSFNPTIGELLPHFYAGTDFTAWQSCEKQLLSHTAAKLKRRSHSRALAADRAVMGNPKTAPDALFALDGRMTPDEYTRALNAMAKIGAPEVVLVIATRQVRFQTKSWRGALSRFCLALEHAFPEAPPGVVIVTDEPNSAFQLRKSLWDLNNKRVEGRWKRTDEYSIVGIPSADRLDGLLPSDIEEKRSPEPREFDCDIVDAGAAKVVGKLYRIATNLPGGREAAEPLIDAANYLNRLAALPCGVSDLVQWLSDTDVEEHQRQRFSWAHYYAALAQFERAGTAGSHRKDLLECMEQGERIYSDYKEATPFAVMLANRVGHIGLNKRNRIFVVFTSSLHKRLAEQFLENYPHYPGEAHFSDFSDRVYLLVSSRLEERLAKLDGAGLIFAGIDDEGLRIIMSDDRIPPHTAILLTQQNGHYLRGMLQPLVEKFQEFKPYKPRMESVLRKLMFLPNDPIVLATSDLVLPSFRVELTSQAAADIETSDPEAWTIVLEGGLRLPRRPNHRVYVYDPSSASASDRGFRASEVKSLEPGDKLFVMSSELRELVESVLKESGVEIAHDKTFEGALRDHHQKVIQALERLFPTISSIAERARRLRQLILNSNSDLGENFPSEQAIRLWINLEQSTETAFDKLRPQAPMQEAHFEAFASALGFDKLTRAYLWQRVIMPIRNARRIDGRHVSEIYAHMLLQPESVLVHSKVGRSALKIMFDRALECLNTVISVIPKAGGSQHG